MIQSTSTAGAAQRRATALGAGAALCALVLAMLAMGAAQGAEPARSTGCDKPASPGTVTLRSKDGYQMTRTYTVQIPAGYTPSRPYPLIFVFHAAGGNMAQSRGWGLQNAAGAAGNGIFVFPEGIPFQREGIGWDDRSGGYDLPLFDHLLADVEAGFCIDKDRVFAAGFSWGGDFTTALLCQRGDVLRAVAVNSVSDEYKDKADYRTYQNLPCSAHQPPAIRFGHAVGGDAQYPPPYFATTSKLFQYLNSCSTASTPVPASSPVMSCAAFTSCKSPLIECAFDHSLGHTLPPNWAQDTWDFFMAQSK